jgi:hypothetical protein
VYPARDRGTRKINRLGDKKSKQVTQSGRIDAYLAVGYTDAIASPKPGFAESIGMKELAVAVNHQHTQAAALLDLERGGVLHFRSS